MSKRKSQAEIDALREALKKRYVKGNLAEIAAEYGFTYFTALYHAREIGLFAYTGFTEEQKQEMETNPNKLSAKQFAEKFGKTTQDVYSYLSYRKIKLPNAKTLDAAARLAKIKALAPEHTVAQMVTEVGLSAERIKVLCKEHGINLMKQDKNVLAEHEDYITKLGETMNLMEIHHELENTKKINISYCAVSCFCKDRNIQFQRKKKSANKVYVARAISKFEPYKERVMKMLHTHTWAEIAAALNVSESWIKGQANQSGVKKKFVKHSLSNAKSIGTAEDATVVSRGGRKPKNSGRSYGVVKKEEKPMVIRENEETMKAKTAVRIDHKTVVWLRPGVSVEDWKRQHGRI